jgi:hypothetical protein
VDLWGWNIGPPATKQKTNVMPNYTTSRLLKHRLCPSLFG